MNSKVTNQGLKTTNIKGKDYVEVNQRISYFRNEPRYAGWSLRTEIVQMDADLVVIKASTFDYEGVERSTGLAFEERTSSFVNKTSYVENCETSAVGRCLGNLGIGIDTSVASAEEVNNAINNQKKRTNKAAIGSLQITKLKNMAKDAKVAPDYFKRCFTKLGIKDFIELDLGDYSKLFKDLETKARQHDPKNYPDIKDVLEEPEAGKSGSIIKNFMNNERVIHERTNR